MSRVLRNNRMTMTDRNVGYVSLRGERKSVCVSLCELIGTILCAVFGIMTTRHHRVRIVPARATRRRTAKDFAG
jgi:hypothetical protein